MSDYVLYNNDHPAARFVFAHGMVKAFAPTCQELLPMQIRAATPDGFMRWISERAIDLNAAAHRSLVMELLGSRDKLTLAIMTHIFSISDTFTCFEEGAFVPRSRLCSPQAHEAVSDYILLTSDTSIRNARLITPNVSTDGSFTKTWKHEDGEWWLYKLQSADATRSEVEISKVLLVAGWSALTVMMLFSCRPIVVSVLTSHGKAAQIVPQ